MRSRKDDSTQETDRLIDMAVMAMSAAHGTSIQVNGAQALTRLGISIDEEKANVYWSPSSKRCFHICGRTVEVRKVSPRKVALSESSAGLAVTALWHLGKNRLTPERMREIVSALSTQEQSLLHDSRSVLPGWASDALIDTSEDHQVGEPANPPVTTRNVSKAKKSAPASKAEGGQPKKKRASKDVQPTQKRWTRSSAEGRWSGFGPYYAMFPVEFARSVVANYCPPGGRILDPFCGRGTVPFVGLATGRESAGCDINPVAWIYAKVKTDTHPDKDAVIRRSIEIGEGILDCDRVPENEFQEWAWCPDVLSYLNAARRLLDWRDSSIDRTLMGFLLVHLHAKLGNGISNQMRQSKAMSPAYSVNWWKKHNMLPPQIDILEYIKRRVEWRYHKGIVATTADKPTLYLEDVRTAFQKLPEDFDADLVFTSPPYCGVTNYRYDNWIRLWLLGEGPALANGDTKQRYANKEHYKQLLEDAFSSCSNRTKDTAIVYVRTDAREFTLQTTISALQKAWPEKNIFFTHDGFKKATQTALFGDSSKKPGEVDLLLLPAGKDCPEGFAKLPAVK